VGALWCVRVPTDGQLPMREMWFGDEVEAQASAEYVVPVRCQLLGELQSAGQAGDTKVDCYYYSVLSSHGIWWLGRGF